MRGKGLRDTTTGEIVNVVRLMRKLLISQSLTFVRYSNLPIGLDSYILCRLYRPCFFVILSVNKLVR